ncbi:MAG: DEAD/DEAH box helicase [archaeon]
MSESNIYAELAIDIVDSERFRQLYEEVLKLQYLQTRDNVNLTFDDIKFLLQSAAIFAFSTEESKQIAYKIATILSERYSEEYDKLNQIVQYILINSGQLPVIKKNIYDGNNDYFSIYSDYGVPLDPFVFKNIFLKKALNQLPLEFEGQPVFLTDFQSKLFGDLVDGKSISISAPTSAGKSFLLKAYLAKQFKEREKFTVVYIVPTRALISQVQRDFKIGLKGFSVYEVNVSSSPEYNNDRAQKKLFILTQERFHNLLFDVDFQNPLDMLIIDEAQKVSDAGRGILLEEVIEEAIKRNIRMNCPLQKIFLSPFSKNPQKFAEMFNLNDTYAEKTKLSPVAQNLLELDLDDNSYSLKLVTTEFSHKISIAQEALNPNEYHSFREIRGWEVLWAAKKFGSDINIIYCNSADKSVELAMALSDVLNDVNDEEINEAISFIEQNIHTKYFMINCLKKGVAYHHGGLPSQIRNLIEELFRRKKLRYIFCTSTLLEGVNLPAQNIFIFKPKQGRVGMSRLNFWNLAGRAGRLLRDYYGNIFCINISEWSGYKPNPNDVEQDIESILESTFITKNKEVLDYLKGIYKKLKQNDLAIEQAVAKFIIREMKEGETKFIEDLLKRNPAFEADKLKAIQEEIQTLAKSIELPAEIVQKNSSINPLTQQKLLEYFRTNSPPVTIHPTDSGFYDSLVRIFKLINQHFRHKEDNQHKYHAFLASKWIHNTSVPELIESKIKRLSENSMPTDKMINTEIDVLFEDINQELRFEYQKFLKCYIDILLYYYKESNYDSTKICEYLPIYLEYGTYQKNIIALQSIGLSRSTALMIGKFVTGSFSDEVDCAVWLKQNKTLLGTMLPRLVQNEVNGVL